MFPRCADIEPIIWPLTTSKEPTLTSHPPHRQRSFKRLTRCLRISHCGRYVHIKARDRSSWKSLNSAPWPDERSRLGNLVVVAPLRGTDQVGKVDTAAEVVPYPARMPPSMVNSAPVQYDEFSEARNAASRPTSSGLPTRGTGRFEKCSSST
jgi:hypothetical protein